MKTATLEITTNKANVCIVHLKELVPSRGEPIHIRNIEKAKEKNGRIEAGS